MVRFGVCIRGNRYFWFRLVLWMWPLVLEGPGLCMCGASSSTLIVLTVGKLPRSSAPQFLLSETWSLTVICIPFRLWPPVAFDPGWGWTLAGGLGLVAWREGGKAPSAPRLCAVDRYPRALGVTMVVSYWPSNPGVLARLGLDTRP